ncbi:hypothetical protein CW304_25530 [Bacillus sp. UFRGS-B20]|nr:hypothetical protein CW304_25530 [Bacillus sp. UFRGS-B20]
MVRDKVSRPKQNYIFALFRLNMDNQHLPLFLLMATEATRPCKKSKVVCVYAHQQHRSTTFLL